MDNEINERHWDDLKGTYNNVWQIAAKKILSEKETMFIKNFYSKKIGPNVLDIGIGNGRILSALMANAHSDDIIKGIDISDEMIAVCQEKFAGKSNCEFKKCDIASSAVPFHEKFDFVTAVRVLKYNKNWIQIVEKISKQLNSGGIFVFTMPNKYSLNYFSSYKIPFYKSCKSELEILCKKNGLQIQEIISFTRIPDVIYDHSNNRAFALLVAILESILSVILGKTFFGRMFFIAAKKI